MRQQITAVMLLALIFFSSCDRQNPENYNRLISEARDFYRAGDYENSGEKFSEAFESVKEVDTVMHRYEAAQAWALAGEKDLAFAQLEELSEEDKYADLAQISTDNNLNSLRTDERWIGILNKVSENGKEELEQLSKVSALLEIVYRDDQIHRQELGELEEKYAHDSEEIKAQWELIRKQDSINLIKVKQVLDEHGWLSWKRIGRSANSALFLVIQHADIETQEEYLPMLREAVKDGNAAPADLALLEDRVALRQGKKQIYGSQIGIDQETGEYYISPLMDPDNVNQRRAEVGLEPLGNYVSNWNLTWDAETYKKQLPRLEVKEWK